MAKSCVYIPSDEREPGADEMRYRVVVADSELDRRPGETLAEAQLRAGKTVRVMIAAGLVNEFAGAGFSESEILSMLAGIASRNDADRLIQTIGTMH